MKRILIVDDDKFYLDGMLEVLASPIYKLEKVMSGPEALEKMKTTPYDLVILDYNMKPMNGLEVLEAMTKEGYRSAVIMITGYGTFDLATKAIAKGAVTMLAKPVEPQRLRAEVKRILQERILSRKSTLTPSSISTRKSVDTNTKYDDDATNILLVDDSKVFQTIISNTFRSYFEDVNIVIATNGTEAIEKLSKHKFKLILLDINMPHMNGIEFLKLKSRSIKFGNVPVIILSTEKRKEIREEAINFGASIFLGKPFKKEDLVEVVKDIFSKKKF